MYKIILAQSLVCKKQTVIILIHVFRKKNNNKKLTNQICIKKHYFYFLPGLFEINLHFLFIPQAINNVIDTLVDCRQLNEKLPKVKWTEPIFDMVTLLMEAAIEFSSKNFVSLISGDMLRKIDKVTFPGVLRSLGISNLKVLDLLFLV